MCWENDHRLLPTNTESQEHHRLSACICSDMMRYGIFGIEKTTSLKVLMGGHHLIELGQQEQMKTSWYLR